MISYEKAIEIISEKVSFTPKTKMMSVLGSVKHICAEDIYATFSLPATDISLKDGIALCKDTQYEVSTGDPLKEGTTAVIPHEEIQNKKEIYFKQNIKEAEEDIKKGELLVKKDDYITAYSITALASQGIKKIKVYNRLKVSILSIGDNLCPVQKEIQEGEIYNSNALSLAARILEIGASVYKVWQAKNNQKEIIQCMKELSEKSDFIITTGAMSQYDAMSKTIYNDNFSILFHKVQIAPASPTALTIFHQTPILHLTGLPLSSLLGFELLGVPIIKNSTNEHIMNQKSIFVKNEKTFTCKDECVSAIPGYFNGLSFKSAPSFGAGMLNILSKCNGYALIKNEKIVKENQIIEFFSF